MEVASGTAFLRENALKKLLSLAVLHHKQGGESKSFKVSGFAK